MPAMEANVYATHQGIVDRRVTRKTLTFLRSGFCSASILAFDRLLGVEDTSVWNNSSMYSSGNQS